MTKSLADLLAAGGPILLDFDGPVCSIFAGYPAHEIAESLRAVILTHGIDVPPNIDLEPDPLEVLRWSAGIPNSDVLTAVEDALRDAEATAVLTAAPTPHVTEALVAAHEAGRPVAIASNNSEPAIRSYLDRNGLAPLVRTIAGRIPNAPQAMKPDPSCLHRAIRTIDVQELAILVGDSLTDIEAARKAQIAVIGYADRSHNAEAFLAAGADAVITDMEQLALALRV